MNRLKLLPHFPLLPLGFSPLRALGLATLLCCVVFWPRSVCANWSWPNETVMASWSDGQWVAEFPFNNPGKTPLTVQNLQFACTCDEYRFKATPAEPGKTGVLQVLLGTEPKGASVELVAFGSGEATPTMLTIELQSKPATPK